MPDSAQEVLAAAAIIGRHAFPRLLAAVTDWADVAALPSALAALCRAHLLVEEGHVYRFAHDLIREVIAADLGVARRLQLHHRVATALARGQEAASVPEVIAYHSAQTEEHETAAYWLEQAGNYAAALCSTATAIEHYAAAYTQYQATGGADALSQLLSTSAMP